MDYPAPDEARKHLSQLRELLADYVSAEEIPWPGSVDRHRDEISKDHARPVPHASREVGYAQGLAQVQLKMRVTVMAIDQCLSTIEAISSAGGVGEYICAHLPPHLPE